MAFKVSLPTSDSAIHFLHHGNNLKIEWVDSTSTYSRSSYSETSWKQTYYLGSTILNSELKHLSKNWTKSPFNFLDCGKKKSPASLQTSKHNWLFFLYSHCSLCTCLSPLLTYGPAITCKCVNAASWLQSRHVKMVTDFITDFSIVPGTL